MDNKKVIQRMQTDEDYRIAMQQHLDELTPDQYRAFLEDDSWAGVPYARSFFHVHSDLGSPMDSVLTVRAYHVSYRPRNDVRTGSSGLVD